VPNKEHFKDLDKLNMVMMVLVLGSSQFFMLFQLPQKIMLAIKVVKNDSKNNHLAS